MTVRKLSSFKGGPDAVEPYLLDLEDGTDPVEFMNPNKMKSADAFELAESSDPKRAIELLLGDNFKRAWDAVLGALEIDRLQEISEDVREYFRVSDK